jgi:hypothetical protein
MSVVAFRCLKGISKKFAGYFKHQHIGTKRQGFFGLLFGQVKLPKVGRQ